MTRPVPQARVARIAESIGQMGPTRLLRLFVLVIFVGAMAQTVTFIRADLARPTDLSSDTGNYFAAGQRLNDGSPLYALVAGDHPVAQDNDPLWTVPLLSPPTIAVLWRPLSLGPASFVMQLWWLGGAVATSLTVLWLILRLPVPGLLAVLGLAYPIAVVAWSGNANAYILPGLACVWPLSLSSDPRARAVAGVLVAVTGALKLSPILLSGWFVIRRDRASIAALGLTVLCTIGLIAVFAGLESGTQYLEIARATTTAGATPWSPTGWLVGLGVPESGAKLGPFLVGIAALGCGWLMRSRPRLSFAALAAGAAFASPVARVETLAMLAVCLAPWTTGQPDTDPPPVRSTPAVGRSGAMRVAALAVAAVIVVAVAGFRAATTPSTAVWIQNDTDRPKVVRFYVYVVPASFGYVVPAGSGGWAWAGEPGESDLVIAAYGDGCTVLEKTPRIRVSEMSVTLTRDGMRLAPESPSRSSTTDGRGFLPYTHECAGA